VLNTVYKIVYQQE